MIGWWVRRRRIGAVLVLSIGLAVTALPAAGRGTGGDAGTDGISELLDRRAAAVAAGDLDAWLAEVDPDAPAAFVEQQRTSFAGLAAVDAESYRLRLDEDTGDLSPPGLSEHYGARTHLPATEARYRLGRFDDRDAVDDLWWTYVERDGRWWVAGDRDLEVVGLRTQRQIWDLVPVETVTDDRVMVISSPQRRQRARDVAGLMTEALAIFDERWSAPWSGQLVVVVPDSADAVEEILQTTLDLTNFVAFVGYGVDRDDGYETTAPRMYLQDERLSRRSRAFQVETLVHELVHAATAEMAGPFVDSWVHEGLADWIALGRPGALAPPAGTDGAIPDAFEFRTGSREDIIRSYDEATSAMSLIADAYGPDAPVAYFTELGRRRIEPGDTDHHVSAALTATVGVDLETFEQRWSGG